MSLIYQKYQNKNEESKAFGKWYARAIMKGTVGIEELAEKMQDNCTVKRTDILAVLSELGPTMRDIIQDSKRVQIPYLGAFKLGISTSGADTPENFSVRKHVKNVHVIFMPLTKISATGTHEKELAKGVVLTEDNDYVSPTTEEEPDEQNP